jgi:hypothetical protein
MARPASITLGRHILRCFYRFTPRNGFTLISPAGFITEQSMPTLRVFHALESLIDDEYFITFLPRLPLPHRHLSSFHF